MKSSSTVCSDNTFDINLSNFRHNSIVEASSGRTGVADLMENVYMYIVSNFSKNRWEVETKLRDGEGGRMGEMEGEREEMKEIMSGRSGGREM